MSRMTKRSIILFAAALLILPIVTGWPPSAWTADQEFGISLSDQELDEMRGGYSGIHFGIKFSGYWDKLGNVSGSLVAPVPSSLPSPPDLPKLRDEAVAREPLALGDKAVVQAYVGNFRGATGIFQISQSPGNYNVIHNNLILNITLIHLTRESALPALMKYLTLP